MVLDPRLDAPQYWFLGGISAAFLARLFQADPDPEHLADARWWMALAMDAADVQLHYPAACKGSWGASLLWQLTGEPAYEAFAWRMGDWYLAGQQPEGWWHHIGGSDLAGVIEITLEFVMHLDTLIGALAVAATRPRLTLEARAPRPAIVRSRPTASGPAPEVPRHLNPRFMAPMTADPEPDQPRVRGSDPPSVGDPLGLPARTDHQVDVSGSS